MGKKLTLACMLVIALSIIVPLSGATMYAEDRPAVTAPMSVALEIDAADVALVYTASQDGIAELACSAGESMAPPGEGSYCEFLNASPETEVGLCSIANVTPSRLSLLRLWRWHGQGWMYPT